ncbi:MAG: amidohydrolase family protein [Anaerolineae bacterium]
MFDFLIKDVQVVDGSGQPASVADVALQGDLIVEVGGLGAVQAERTVDGKGLVAAPGFIDMHTHSDFTLPANPLAESKIRQGVTTEVIGNCGLSPAPLNPATKEDLLQYTGFLQPLLTWEWTAFGGYLDHLREVGTAVNVVPLVGHGTVRIAVMGFADAPPTRKQMKEMKELVAQAMDEGAFGLSTGLIYPPGCYAATDELVELSRVAAAHNGHYFSHIRGEAETLLEAIEEAITIGREAGLPVEIAHFKAAGQTNWDKAPEAVALVEQARQGGLDLSADLYPYLAGSTNLSALLPAWAHEGGVTQLLARLGDDRQRRRIREEMTSGKGALGREVGYDRTYIALCPGHPQYEGKTLIQIGEVRNQEAVDVLFDLLLETDCQAGMITFMMSEDNFRLGLSQPWMMVGSDGLSLAPYGKLGQGKRHPRSYGTFPRILARYVREEGMLSLPQAIRKMTALPAEKLGLADRGRLQKGMKADIVLFDPVKVEDQATYAEPYQYPSGVEYVFVNGQLTVERGQHSGALAGRVLERR